MQHRNPMTGGNIMKIVRNAALGFALIGMLGFSACNQNAGDKETLGSLGGAALGGLAGEQVGSGV